MTFRGQVRWALTRGLAAGALGVVLAFAAVIFEAQEWPFWQDAAGFTAVGLICGARCWCWAGLSPGPCNAGRSGTGCPRAG